MCIKYYGDLPYEAWQVTILAMSEFDTIEDRVRASLNMARQKFEVQKLAEKLGIHRKTLSPFLSGKSSSDTIIIRGEEFARKEGYWPWDSMDPIAASQRTKDGFIEPDVVRMAVSLRAFKG
jgi:hypothetical protein